MNTFNLLDRVEFRPEEMRYVTGSVVKVDHFYDESVYLILWDNGKLYSVEGVRLVLA
jgi:hypothetical protein